MSDAVRPSDAAIPSDDDPAIEELTRRPSRSPDHATEARALAALARMMEANAGGVLQTLAELIVELCHAASAGVSILEPGGGDADGDGADVFRWHAIAGAHAAYLGGTIARDASPCGMVIDRDTAMLVKDAAHLFPALKDVEPPVDDVLLVPWHVDGRAIGTVWAIGSPAHGQFDAEDARLLTSLAAFASAAHQMATAFAAAKTGRAQLEQRVEERTRALSASNAALRASGAWLRQALDVGRMGAWQWNVRTNKASWSDGIYTSLGYRPGEVEPNNGLYLRHVHPDDRQGLEAALDHCVRTHQSFEYSYRIIRLDGETIWCEARGAFEHGDDGNPMRLIGITADVTERHKADGHLQKLQAELSRALRLNAMGLLTSTLAHDLNQPLTAMTSYVETARDMLDKPDPRTLAVVRQAMDRAASAAVHASQIVHRLRDFVARGELDKRLENLPALINDAADLALFDARDRGIRIDMQLARSAAVVLADRAQIQQVLVNLIRNAVEAMTDSPRRKLTIASAVNAEGCAEVSVADSGPGIAAEVVEQLFQPFVSTKREGLGLGLSICRTIVDAHGGRVWATPNRGGGTVFSFTLPLDHANASDRSRRR